MILFEFNPIFAIMALHWWEEEITHGLTDPHC